MDSSIWSVIFGGCLVTVLPRVLPITLLAKTILPEKLVGFLACLPVAILAALLAAELLLDGQHPALSTNGWKLLAALPTLWVAIRKDDLLLTVFTGIASLALLRFLCA